MDATGKPETQDLVAAIGFLYRQGWAPATSSNYSIWGGPGSQICISQSGVDKSQFSTAHLMEVDLTGQPTDTETRKPSAETGLHTLIYRRFASTRCVLHTHSVAGTVLSMMHAREGAVVLSGFEVLKGIEGTQTHQTKLLLPIFKNRQDIPALVSEIEAYLERGTLPHGFLIEGHGLYAWGTSIAQAKRHIEVYEFLFECLLELSKHGHTQHS